MKEFADLVKRCIAELGMDPNDLGQLFELTVAETGLWVLWDDWHWRPNLVCSKCGSLYGSKSPLSHRNQEGVALIPWNEWKKLEAKP